MTKKAQSMPLNVIIVAVLLLIVLVVLLFIFTGKMRGFSKGVQSCTMQGGTCKAQGTCSAEELPMDINTTDCKSPEPICCIPILAN